MDRRARRLEGQLCKAVKDEEPRCVQLLLSEGACPHLVGSKGVAAIHLAVGKETEKNIRCLKMLLQYGGDPNVRSSEGLTPLHIAALWGCYQNLKLLLINGGNPNSKDNDGNTPGQLAEQQENRRCAQLLQEHQVSSVDTEDDDLPQFQYSVYSDQKDTSSYPESDYSFSSHSSMISDFGEAPLSSTRRSSFFNMSHINGRPSYRGPSYNRLSETDFKRNHGQDWNNSSSQWASECPSILSSTRMSAVGPAAALQVLKEDDVLSYNDGFTSKAKEHAATTDSTISPSRRDTLPAFPSRRVSRKSVSFRDVDEYFPVFSPEFPKQKPAVDDGQCGGNLPFDLSEYSDFLDSERMATVLQKQGIDVTSPDHVYVFCRESSESTEENMEKTVISHCVLEESGDEEECDRLKEAQANIPEQPASDGNGSGSSGSSHYSSCESDHYTSALEASLHPKHLVYPRVEDVSVGVASNERLQNPTQFSESGGGNHPHVHTDPKMDIILETTGMEGNLLLSGSKHQNDDVYEACSDFVRNPLSEVGDDQPVAENAADALREDFNLPFTPSPFVTGRTRSRLSRCSLRTSRTPASLLSTSSLFEETLPTPVRTRRQTPRSPSREEFYHSPHAPCYTPSYSGSSMGGNSFPTDSQDTQSSTLRAGSSVSHSQADTLILPKSVTNSTSQSQTLSDTVVLEKDQNSSMDAYERNLAEIILAMQGQDLAEGGEFLTDDLTSTDEAITKVNTNKASLGDKEGNPKYDDAWITEECSSQPDSVSSSSSSSYFSPRRSREDSDLPCTPGTGCTPRYSMSRLSSCRRPQHLAKLSYTPGGRPLIQDIEEPVEYLYTDTEEGHKLIETHVPPTADTSLSSSMSTAATTSSSSSEETIIYDWRSMHSDMMEDRGKENEKPPRETQEEGKEEERVMPDTRGMTDKELRSRLLELGESPGPISSRTRPGYMKRLCRLLQESNSKSRHQQKQIDQPQTDLGYSPELCRALRTFELPCCHADEQALCQQFDQPDQNRKWREGIIKSSFNYLLLDPRVTKNLPFRSHTTTPHECFQTFINAIFYVGKGKRSRPYSHLYEALEYYKGDKTSKKLCTKVQHILQVWGAEQGVISLHCFQNVIPVEAYTREACMVEAIGLKMLTNKKRGDFYGVVSNWQVKRKRELGVHLLYRAMQIFLAEGERQLRPADIRQ